MKRPRYVCARFLAPAILLGLICLLVASLWPPSFVDDAYISFRYALRLGCEHTLEWNRGERPIEGYSNPLWVFLLSPFAAANVPLDTPAFWMGFLSLAGSVLLVFFLCTSASNSALLGFSAALGLLFSPGVIQSSLMGLETSLYGFLMLFSCMLYAGPLPSLTGSWRRILVLCLLSITRFEGFVLALAIPCVAILSEGERRLRTMMLRETGIVGAFVAACFLSRWIVFRDLLPMPIHAKSSGLSLILSMNFGEFFTRYLVPSLKYTWQAGNTSILVCLVAVLVAMLVGQRRSRMPMVYPAAVLLTLAMCILNGGDWMPGFRLLTPALGCLFVGGIFAVNATGLLNEHRFLMLAYCAALALIPMQTFDARGLGQISFDKSQEHTWNDAGRWMNRIVRPNDLCLVEQIGRIGYFGPDLRIIDFQGLVNEKIAKAPVCGSHFGKRRDELVLSLCPALIQSCNPGLVRTACRFFSNSRQADYDYLHMPHWRNVHLLIRKDISARKQFVLPSSDSSLIDIREADPCLANQVPR